jgi:multimeric flavodoxin WrbA
MNLFKGYDQFGTKPNVVIFNGSPRKENSCANQTSKTRKLVDYVLDKYSDRVNLQVVDLSVGKVNIQPCKGCVSTSNGFHCHWKCTCYSKHNQDKPDLMYEADIYDKLEACDAFIVVSPIHWYTLSTQVKAMFDRLVCANLTITREQALQLFGEDAKNSEVTGAAELSGKYNHLLKNHLHGKIAAFYAHGDDGANDYGGDQPHTGDENWDVKNSVLPFVYQCRYSGMRCPDDLVEAFYINKGVPYYEANAEMPYEREFFNRMDNLVRTVLKYIEGSHEEI